MSKKIKIFKTKKIKNPNNQHWIIYSDEFMEKLKGSHPMAVQTLIHNHQSLLTEYRRSDHIVHYEQTEELDKLQLSQYNKLLEDKTLNSHYASLLIKDIDLFDRFNFSNEVGSGKYSLEDDIDKGLDFLNYFYGKIYPIA